MPKEIVFFDDVVDNARSRHGSIAVLYGVPLGDTQRPTELMIGIDNDTTININHWGTVTLCSRKFGGSVVIARGLYPVQLNQLVEMLTEE